MAHPLETGKPSVAVEGPTLEEAKERGGLDVSDSVPMDGASGDGSPGRPGPRHVPGLRVGQGGGGAALRGEVLRACSCPLRGEPAVGHHGATLGGLQARGYPLADGSRGRQRGGAERALGPARERPPPALDGDPGIARRLLVDSAAAAAMVSGLAPLSGGAGRMGGIPGSGACPETLPGAGGPDHQAGGLGYGALPESRRHTPAGCTRERSLPGAKQSGERALPLSDCHHLAKSGRLESPAPDSRCLRCGASSRPKRPLVRRRALPVCGVATPPRTTRDRRGRGYELPARLPRGARALPPPRRGVRRG